MARVNSKKDTTIISIEEETQNDPEENSDTHMTDINSRKRPAPSLATETTETTTRRINIITPKTVNSKSRNRRKRLTNKDPARDSLLKSQH